MTNIIRISIKSRGKDSSFAQKNSPTYQDAVLCTNDRTFQLRQVHSSNAIFLVRPAVNLSCVHDPGAVQISIIGSSKVTLECLSHNPTPRVDIMGLPMYRGPGGSESDLRSSSPVRDEPCSKSAITMDTPCSKNELELAWIDLVAFEENGEAFRPTPKVLLKLWQVIHTTSTAEGLLLEKPFSISELWELVKLEGYPRPLVEAFIRRLESGSTNNDCKPNPLSHRIH